MGTVIRLKRADPPGEEPILIVSSGATEEIEIFLALHPDDERIFIVPSGDPEGIQVFLGKDYATVTRMERVSFARKALRWVWKMTKVIVGESSCSSSTRFSSRARQPGNSISAVRPLCG